MILTMLMTALAITGGQMPFVPAKDPPKKDKKNKGRYNRPCSKAFRSVHFEPKMK